MNVHQNARLTVSCRVLLVERILSGRAQAAVAAELGVSVRTAGKWFKRYQDLGVKGLKDRSSRPHRSAGATDEVLRSVVVALRRQRLTLVTIAAQLNQSRATVARIARGVRSRLRQLQPALPRLAAMATWLQLAPAPQQLGWPTTHPPTGPRQEQPVETPHLGHPAIGFIPSVPLKMKSPPRPRNVESSLARIFAASFTSGTTCTWSDL